MNNSVNGSDQARAMWKRAQERPWPVVVIVLLVTLFIALAGYPWIWLVGGAVVLAVLMPTLMKLGGGSANSTSPAQGPALSISTPQPDMSRLQGHYLDLVRRTFETRKRIESVVAQTQEPGQRQVLAQAISDLPELSERVYDLACKAQTIENGLGGSNPMGTLADEIKQLEAEMNSTNDEFQKSQYYSALDGKLQQMQNITDVTVALRRWDSQIENAVSTLDTLLSQVLRIQSSEVLSYTGSTDALSNSLKQQVDSLRATGEAMDNVYGWKK
jgi:hypothetical protein